ncbi:MAG: hypothetical protein H8M99_01365, partial [Gloeobacteraceae cyanobacterium ES-bin-144]|nr:hypothetical protein [Verrucomicrobiales bacterium]
MKLIFLAVATLFATHSAFAVKSRTQPVLPAFAAEPVKTQTGVASWYGSEFIGGKTANGEI